MRGIIVLVVALALAVASVEAAKPCEVCINVVDKVRESITPDMTSDQIEDQIKAYCKTATDRDNRFCYYVGGTADAATYILREISVPLKNSIPSDVICNRLKKKDAQICELVYPEKIDLDSTDFSKLRVKQLKSIVAELGGSCTGCSEKNDFIREINRIRGKGADL